MKWFAAVLGLLLALAQAQAALPAAPVYAGVWDAEEGDDHPGALYVDMDWDHLVARWKSLPGEGLRLADVEVYRKDGQWRYTALWRKGAGNGALLLAPWAEFLKTWKDLRQTQELVDLEVIDDRGTLKFLGVWQRKPRADDSAGALFVDLSWHELQARHKATGKGQYLADVVTYLKGGQRVFAGVWRVGGDNGALYLQTRWIDFVARQRELDGTQKLIDFNPYQTPEGEWKFIGVWKPAAHRGRTIDASSSEARFEPLSAEQLVERWKKREPQLALAGLAGLAVVSAFTALRADTSCAWGARDCNVCARGVEDQFRVAFETGHRPMIGWHRRTWEFRGKDHLPPDGLQPEDAFFPFGDKAQVGVVSKHVQGLVRTNSSRFPFAGSHSHKDTGSLFIVEERDGQAELHSLYRASTAHPSGVAVLGDGLFVSEDGQLRVVRISESGKAQNVVSALNGLGSAGGGLGLAKLHDGRTLLIVSGAGDGFRKGILPGQREENLKKRQTRFFALDDPFEPLPAGLEAFGEWRHPVEARPDKPMGYSENLSVVSDCESGRIYTIHTTGDYGLYGDGYWRLSRVDEGPKLTHLAIARQDQHTERCHHRSAATVHVDKEGQLEFICTERAVIQRSPKGEFTLTEGRR